MKKTVQYVVVRTEHAGVHVGELVAVDGDQVELARSRRLWSWSGARTLHEVAASGVGNKSRVSVVAARVRLRGWTEIVDCAEEGRTSLQSAGWA